MRMPHWPIPTWRQNFKRGTENILSLMEVLGNPHLNLPPTIHIAGTNGKGSSVAMFQAIFEAANYRVHAYTSPHLIEFNERIVIRNEKIRNDCLFEILEKTRLAANTVCIEPTFFEGVTAAAFLAFSETPADILILETGIGGRLDSTNIINNPILSLITPISYDHVDYLGHTLPLIASEKAGIIKRGTPCVISSQVQEVYDILLKKCQEIEAPAFCYEYDFGIKKTKDGFTYSSKSLSSTFPVPSLLGDHQFINAGSVIAGISLINGLFKINSKQIARGLQNTHWPARIQKINNTRYAARPNISIFLDGAHNNGGAQVLSHWIKQDLNTPIYMIVGMTKNRNIEEFCSYFKDTVTKAYGVKVLSEASSYSAEEISTRGALTGINFESADSIEEAIEAITAISTQPLSIIICGSLFLAADFLSIK
jgi:dihydrofolate synthase / folylpolyglutamate synthase